MNIDAHKRNLKESLDVLRECIEKGLKDRQRTVGFHASTAACDMLEMLLHKKNLIDPGAVIKHDWFASERSAKEHLPFEFPNKEQILKLMINIENKRNILCYGKQQTDDFIEEVINSLNILKSKFMEAGLDEL